MVTKAAVTFVAVAALLGPCDPTGLKPPKDLAGMWGGENAALIADDTSAHIHIGCTYGNIHNRIMLDAGGRFDMAGEQNITAHPVDRGILHPARFSGRVIGSTMTLTVTLTDTTVTLGPVLLWYGKEPRMGPCPICRRP
ncbi:MAG: hypothetical protein DMD59_13950 [Gemmatimonadetes bacterium]|nr:MAG: hypothetical protein DMD59_13950 [Gemmatimonadota bacterium]